MDAPHEVQNFASNEFRPLHFGHFIAIGGFYHDADIPYSLKKTYRHGKDFLALQRHRTCRFLALQ
ncbi:hypothetical protein M1N24_02335 [Dehalococcoidia bacterium]|nr:hypothetical protein [Dehalococcoidia bacterium]